MLRRPAKSRKRGGLRPASRPADIVSVRVVQGVPEPTLGSRGERSREHFGKEQTKRRRFRATRGRGVRADISFLLFQGSPHPSHTAGEVAALLITVFIHDFLRAKEKLDVPGVSPVGELIRRAISSR